MPGACLQEQLVQRRISRGRAELAVKGHQSAQGFIGLGLIDSRQGGDGVFQRLGHARCAEHGLEFGGKQGGLVVLHGDHAAGILFAAACQLGQAFAALRR